MGSSIDDILREIGMDPAPKPTAPPEPDPVLLDSDAELELLLCGLMDEDSGKKPEKPVLPSESPAAPVKPPEPPAEAVPPPAPQQSRKQNPPAADEKPVRQPVPDVTGNIRIDIDSIRAEQPPVRPVPAQLFSEEEDGRPESHLHLAEKVREKSPVQELAEEAPRYAPPFRKLGQELEKEQPAVQMEKLRASARKAGILGLILLLAAAGLTAFTAAAQIYRMKTPPQVPTTLTLIAMTALGAAAGGLSWQILWSGLRSVFRFEPNRETLPALTFCITLVQAVVLTLSPDVMADSNIQYYLPVGVLTLAFAWFSRAMVLRTAVVNAKLVFSDYRKFVPQPVTESRMASDLTRGLVEGYGVPVINRETDLLSDFLSISFGSDRSDTSARNLTISGLLAGGGAGLFTFFFSRNPDLSITIMTAVMAVFCPLTNLFCTAYPLCRSAKFLNRKGGMAAGERCTAECADVNAAVVDAKDLLPASCVTLSGIKTFEGMRIDEAILDAASALKEAGSILTEVFMQMISGRTELLRKVDSLEYEDNGGLSAWIGKKRVLIGNRRCMMAHGVRVPSEEYEKRFRQQNCDMVYFASAGNLTAVFIITLKPSMEADTAIQKLLENDILFSVRTVDSIVTADRLSELYLCEASCFKILPARLHEAVKERQKLVKVKPACLVDNGSFGTTAAVMVTGRRARVMMNISGVIQMVSILLGVGAALTLALMGAMQQFSPLILGIDLLFWLGLDILAQKLVRI